jgi:hypothetical protein
MSQYASQNQSHESASTASEIHLVNAGMSRKRAAVERCSDGLEMTEERLPFTVRLVHSAKDLTKAVKVRQAAYARHVPDLAATMLVPELLDFDNDVVILLAESKLDGSPIGTARIQTNFTRRMSLEDSVELPDWLQGKRMADVTRLGIGEGRIGFMVKLALIKACFEYCEQNGVEWAVVAGRAPIDRQYEQLLFQDVFPGQGFIPMADAGNIPHRVMAFEIASGHARWRAAKHPLLKFFKYTRHPDIDVSRHGVRLDDCDGKIDGKFEQAEYAEEVALAI